MNELKHALKKSMDALIDARDDVAEAMLACEANLTGSEKGARRVAAYQQQLAEIDSAIASAEAALALPEHDPKPVAWVRWVSDGGYEGPIMDCDRRIDDSRRKTWTPLYASATVQSAESATVISERDALRADLGELQAKYADACAEMAAESVGAGKMVVTLDYLRGLKEHCESVEAECARLQSSLDDALAGERVAKLAAGRGIPLSTDHVGMRVDYSGMLGQARRALKSREPGLAEMLRQLTEHLEELARRYYTGDLSVVDELLQLYCLDDGRPAAQKIRAHGIGTESGAA